MKFARLAATAISAFAMCAISSPGFATPFPFMAFDDSYTTPENTELVVSVPGVLSNDTTGGLVSSISSFLTPSSPPPVGTLSLNPDGSFTYTPAPNFTGTDTFSYFDLGQNVTVASSQTSNTATISIDVTPVTALPPATTPLPATLPLFATGLGALGLLGWRRKRKQTAARPIFAAGLALLFGIVVAPPPSSATVISQVYGGGGNSGATYKDDFIEIFNNGTTTQALNGLSVQYSSVTGAFSASALTVLPNTTLAPGQYFLIQEAAGAGGTTNLPSPDATGIIDLSATQGVVALVNGTTGLNCGNPTPCSSSQLAAVIDLVGYGTATLFEGTGPASSPSNTTAIIRAGNGFTDTNDNAADFSVGSPNPRNKESALNVAIDATPLPAALPLFATGLGGLGLLGWRRRKRKQAA